MARVRLTLVMSSGARICPGKADLLGNIRSSGSISAAACALGMYYKRAWTLVDSLNRAFTTPAVVRTAGGAGGGGAALTPFGEDLLARYRRIETTAGHMATGDLEALEALAVPDPSPKV